MVHDEKYLVGVYVVQLVVFFDQRLGYRPDFARAYFVVEFCLCSRGHISFLRFRACAVFSAVLHYTIAPLAA